MSGGRSVLMDPARSKLKSCRSAVRREFRFRVVIRGWRRCYHNARWILCGADPKGSYEGQVVREAREAVTSIGVSLARLITMEEDVVQFESRGVVGIKG